jgi:transposase
MARAATQKTWAERITRWEQSGQTAKVFAAQEGVSAQSLSWWKWKLGQEATDEKAARRAQVVPLSFVRLEPTACEDASEALPLEVVLTDGRVVRVPSRFDAQALRRLVVALEGTEP